MPPDTRWLLLWLSAMSMVAAGALGDWMQGSAISPASLANSNQVSQKPQAQLTLLHSLSYTTVMHNTSRHCSQ